MPIINWDNCTGKNDFCGKTIKELISKEFGENRLKEIEKIKEFKNHTIFFDENKFVPYNGDDNNIISVLDKKSYYDWDGIINGGGNHFIKIYITPHVYFYCDKSKCWIEEDA